MNDKNQVLRLGIHQLPLVIELSDGKGRVERYKLTPAGRKFGAFLQRYDFTRAEVPKRSF